LVLQSLIGHRNFAFAEQEEFRLMSLINFLNGQLIDVPRNHFEGSGFTQLHRTLSDQFLGDGLSADFVSRYRNFQVLQLQLVPLQ
jgi:hypothetical protein